jgi:DNA-binding cell septation regulator SpoVG
VVALLIKHGLTHTCGTVLIELSFEKAPVATIAKVGIDLALVAHGTKVVTHSDLLWVGVCSTTR